MSFWSNLFGGGTQGGGRSRKAPAASPTRQRSPAPRPQRPRPSPGAASRTCAACGAAFTQSTPFCPRCGQPIESPSASSAPSAPSAPSTPSTPSATSASSASSTSSKSPSDASSIFTTSLFSTPSASPAAVPARKAAESGESIATAVQLFNAGKVEQAIAEAKRLIEANPKHARAHGSLGYFLLQERRFDEAFEPLLRALELNPGSKETTLHLRDVVDAFAEELAGICVGDGFISGQGGEKFDEHRRHRRTREIGAFLARIGDSGVFGESGQTYTSEKLMTKVFSEIQVRLSFRDETNALRAAWEGIGGWKVAPAHGV